MPDTLMTIEQLAELLHCSPHTLRCNASRAPYRLPPLLRIGGRVLFRSAAVQMWLLEQETEAAPPHIPGRRRGRPRNAEQLARQKR